MRGTGIFWGLSLVALGVLFLLNTLGILNVDVWGLIGPGILILVGLSVMWGRWPGPGKPRLSKLPFHSTALLRLISTWDSAPAIC